MSKTVMNNALDSRVLRQADCYGQRFMREGRYTWTALPAGGRAIDSARPFVIEVGPRKNKALRMGQHDVVLQWKQGQFTTDETKLAIELGDLVVWHCGQADAPGWEIAGDQDFFGSDRLTNECGYSHAFGLPGRYEWADANGSGVHGVVHVEPASCKDAKSLSQWQAQVSRAELVMIQGDKAERSEVKVVVGQRVYFAVVTSPGITITDRRLLSVHKACREAMQQVC